MEEIKLSVIVPVHNNEAFLPQTLESLTHQTLDGIEIICIDNGSTDGCLDILKSYEAVYPNISVYAQKDMGQAYSMNRGLRLARGEYVAECDSDDFVTLTCYEKAYALATDPKYENHADAVRFGWYGIYSDGRLEPMYMLAPDEYYGVPICPTELQSDETIIVFEKMAALFSGIYRRQFLLDNKLFWREHTNFEDTCVEFKVRALAKDYRLIKEPLYYYRRENPNSGNATIFDDDAIFEQFEEIDRFIDGHNLGHLHDVANAMRYMTLCKWALPRGELTTDRIRTMYERMEKAFAEHPTKHYFFPDIKDWFNYNLIKSGLWKETGLMR